MALTLVLPLNRRRRRRISGSPWKVNILFHFHGSSFSPLPTLISYFTPSFTLIE